MVARTEQSSDHSIELGEFVSVKNVIKYTMILVERDTFQLGDTNDNLFESSVNKQIA